MVWKIDRVVDCDRTDLIELEMRLTARVQEEDLEHAGTKIFLQH